MSPHYSPCLWSHHRILCVHCDELISIYSSHGIHSTPSYLHPIMAKTSRCNPRCNPASPNSSDKSRMPRTQKKKADEDAKTPPSPKRRKANVAVTKRPIRSTHTTSPSPKTTPTTFLQKRHRNSAVKETETKQSSLPLTRRKDPPKLPPLHQHMPSLRPLRSCLQFVLCVVTYV